MNDTTNNNERLVNVFANALGIDNGKVLDDLKYNSIEEWDSVGHMGLVAGLEAEFDIMLETDEIIEMSSIRKIKDILSKHNLVF